MGQISLNQNINITNSLAYLFEKKIKSLPIAIITLNSRLYKFLNNRLGVTNQIKKMIKNLIDIKLFLSQKFNIFSRFKNNNQVNIQNFYYSITPHYYFSDKLAVPHIPRSHQIRFFPCSNSLSSSPHPRPWRHLHSPLFVRHRHQLSASSVSNINRCCR